MFTRQTNRQIITTPTQIMNLLYNRCLSTCQRYAIYTLFRPNQFQHKLPTQLVSDWLVRQLIGLFSIAVLLLAEPFINVEICRSLVTLSQVNDFEQYRFKHRFKHRLAVYTVSQIDDLCRSCYY